MVQNVDYEIPYLRKQMAKCTQQLADADRRHAEYTRNAAACASNYKKVNTYMVEPCLLLCFVLMSMSETAQGGATCGMNSMLTLQQIGTDWHRLALQQIGTNSNRFTFHLQHTAAAGY